MRLDMLRHSKFEPEEIDRYLKAKDRLLALSPLDVQLAALHYLGPKDEVEVLVLPEGVNEPKA